MILLGLDLGSARCGVCILTDGRPTAACTIDVDGDIGACATAILRAVNESEAERLIAEWGAFYIRPNATPQEAAAMARAREIMAVLLDRVEQGCVLMGVTVVRMPAATWRSRIGVTRRKRTGIEGFRHAAWARLNPRRDTTDRAVRVALERHLGDLARTLGNAHERDACGVALGEHMGIPVRPPRVRAPRGPRGARGALAAPAEGPSVLDRLCDAIREHAKPNWRASPTFELRAEPGIRLEVLCIRAALDKAKTQNALRKGITTGRIIKLAIGVYGLKQEAKD